MPSTQQEFVPGPEGVRCLASALRQLPQNFTWDFNRGYFREGCGTTGCAWGLAAVMWPDKFGNNLPGYVLAQCSAQFDMPMETAQKIFYSTIHYFPDSNGEYDNWDKVTPQMVADAIDIWLRSINHPTSQEEIEHGNQD